MTCTPSTRDILIFEDVEIETEQYFARAGTWSDKLTAFEVGCGEWGF